MWKNIVERGRPQMEIWRMRIACWVPEAKTHTNKLCNTHCFPTATVVAWTRLSVTLYSYLHYLSCINWDAALTQFLGMLLLCILMLKTVKP